MIDISAHDGAPPKTGRALEREKSECDVERQRIKRERDDLWARATKERKRFLSLVVSKTMLQPRLNEVLQTLRTIKEFKGTKLEAHRAWIFSCDLFAEHATAPWCNEPPWSQQGLQAIQYILSQKNEYDVIFLFDGRSRNCRRQIEKAIDEVGSATVTEMHIHFKPTSRAGRRVAFSSHSVETFYVISQFPRVQMKSVERTKFNALGECSSHDAAYSGVPQVDWAKLPMIGKEDKQICNGGAEVPSPSAGIFDVSGGSPMYWQEGKPEELFLLILREWKVQQVVDMSPGSGTLARACMKQGWLYTGLCRSNEHSSWLQNVLNRRAVQVIATSGTALFEQDLASCIKGHFKELLDELHEQDNAVDEGSVNPRPLARGPG